MSPEDSCAPLALRTIRLHARAQQAVLVRADDSRRDLYHLILCMPKADLLGIVQMQTLEKTEDSEGHLACSELGFTVRSCCISSACGAKRGT